MKTLRFLVCNWEVSWDKNTRPLVDQFLCQSVFVSINFFQQITELPKSFDRFTTRCVFVGEFLCRSLSVSFSFYRLPYRLKAHGWWLVVFALFVHH